VTATLGSPMLLPSLTAHNVSGLFIGAGIRDFLAYLKTLAGVETTIDRSSREGISITDKRR
jgi:hypothetical protein